MMYVNSIKVAETTGLEPATSAVTGQCSNQLSYVSTNINYNQSINDILIIKFYLSKFENDIISEFR